MLATITRKREILVAANETDIFVFVFDSAHRDDVCNVLGRFASDPDISFTWRDAALLALKIDQLKKNNPI